MAKLCDYLEIAKRLKKVIDFKSFRGADPRLWNLGFHSAAFADVASSCPLVATEERGGGNSQSVVVPPPRPQICGKSCWKHKAEDPNMRRGTPYLLLPVREEYDRYWHKTYDGYMEDGRHWDERFSDDRFWDENDDTRDVYSLVKGESIVGSVEYPGFKSKKCLESLGWLLVVGEDGSMRLLNPFSGFEIPVPHQNTFPDKDSVKMHAHEFIVKMVLSSRPSEETSSNFILMIIAGRHEHLATWRLGDKAWTMIEGQSEHCSYSDVVYGGDEQFYAISDSGIISVFNLAGKGPMILHFEPNLPKFDGDYYHQYIVKTVDDSLLIIKRKISFFGEDGMCYATYEFKVYEVDIVKTGTWKEIHSLGSLAVFLGHNSSIALDVVSSGGGMKANRIYFTDDYWKWYHNDDRAFESGVDSGVYNMETGAIKPIYPGNVLMSMVSPALWITPCL